MSNNHMGLGSDLHQKKGEQSEEFVFDTSLIKVPSCKQCCEACHGCKVRYFNKMTVNKDLIV